MKTVLWEVSYLSPPPALRFCIKCRLSQKEFRRLLETGQLCGESGQDLKKCKLDRKNILTALLDPI